MKHFIFREVSEIAPQELPSHNLVKGEAWCDVCVRKSKVNKMAVVYCTVCKKRFCTKHVEVGKYYLWWQPAVQH